MHIANHYKHLNLLYITRIFLLYTFCVFILIPVFAEGSTMKNSVFYSGFAFLGEYADINATGQYPYSCKINNLKIADNRPLLEKKLYEIAKNFNNESFNLIINELGSINSGDTLSMAVALDWEDVAIEKLEQNLFKAVYNLHGQILFVDFAPKKIIASYPFGIRVTDSTHQPPSNDHVLSIFKKMYTDGINGESFIKSFSTTLQNVKINYDMSGFLFKVERVILKPKAKAFLAHNFPNTKENAFKIFTAQQFSSFFAKNLQSSILPYTNGMAIGKIAGRFANGKTFQLDVPKGDYPITITIRGFKKAKIDGNCTGQSWAYGSYIHLQVKSPLEDLLVNSRIKNASVKIIPAGQLLAADSSAFLESLLILFDKTTKQINICDSSWLKKSAEGSYTKMQFKELRKKIHTY